MGQASNTRNDVALDTVITNVVIVDAILGIIKADVGIKVKQQLNIHSISPSLCHCLGWHHCRCR
jgi:urease alpha subunit